MYFRKKQARQSKGDGEDVVTQENGHNGDLKVEDLGSMSDLASVSTRGTHTSVWSTRDPTVNAKPISDPALRQKLKSAKGVKVTPRVSSSQFCSSIMISCS